VNQFFVSAVTLPSNAKLSRSLFHPTYSAMRILYAATLLLCAALAAAQQHGYDDCSICPSNTGKLSRYDAPQPPRTYGCAHAGYTGFPSAFPAAPQFDPCCDQLTLCYVACNVTKSWCDTQFFECILGTCGISTTSNATDVPRTDGTGSVGFTGTPSNPTCSDKAICYAGYLRSNHYCTEYQHVQGNYCYCRALQPIPASIYPTGIPIPGDTSATVFCFNGGVGSNKTVVSHAAVVGGGAITSPHSFSAAASSGFDMRILAAFGLGFCLIYGAMAVLVPVVRGLKAKSDF